MNINSNSIFSRQANLDSGTSPLQTNAFTSSSAQVMESPTTRLPASPKMNSANTSAPQTFQVQSEETNVPNPTAARPLSLQMQADEILAKNGDEIRHLSSEYFEAVKTLERWDTLRGRPAKSSDMAVNHLKNRIDKFPGIIAERIKQANIDLDTLKNAAQDAKEKNTIKIIAATIRSSLHAQGYSVLRAANML